MTNLAPSGLVFSYSREGASATTFDSLGECLLGVAVAEMGGVLNAELLDEAAAAPSTLVPAQAASGDAVSTTAIAARSRRLGSVTPVILSARYPPKHSRPGSEQPLTLATRRRRGHHRSDGIRRAGVPSIARSSCLTSSSARARADSARWIRSRMYAMYVRARPKNSATAACL